MKSDFLLAITQLSAEKKLPRDVVFQAVEQALASAYKKEAFAANQNISVKILPATGEVKVYLQRTVVEEVGDPRREVSLSDAQKLNPKAELGQIVEEETLHGGGGRIAAQTAKQVVLQRLREAEREVAFEEYADKEGDIISGVVNRIEPKHILVDLGKGEAILPFTEQVRIERYRVGQRIKVYVMEVHRAAKGPQVVVSRSHRNLLRRLFELEVPEVHHGVVEIKDIAREAGSRSKVSVVARQAGVDAVGSCVGLRGIRIQNIVSELNGEKVDIVQWHADPRVYIANALSPAQVIGVELDEAERSAQVVVPDRLLSLAIGKEGQNARLAAKLTGWRVDIKSASAAEAERAARAALRVEPAAPPAEEKAPEAGAPREEAAVALSPAAPPVEALPSPGLALGVELPAVEEAPPVEAEEAPGLEFLPPAPAEEIPAPQEAPRIRFAEEILAVPGRGSEPTGKRAKEKRGPIGEEAGRRPRAAARTKKGRPRPEDLLGEELGEELEGELEEEADQ